MLRRFLDTAQAAVNAALEVAAYLFVLTLTLVALGWALAAIAEAGPTETPNGNVHRGKEVAIDLPEGQRVRNTAGTDGAGMCVFASMDMAARWQNVRPLVGIMARLARTERGGGWPEKVDRIVKQHAPGLEIVQYQGTSPAILDLAIRTGRPACITYGYGEFYGNKTIAHMVLLAHLDADLAAVIDNNDPGHITWMARAELLKRWQHGQGYGWAYVLIAPPPPPVPRNGTPTAALDPAFRFEASPAALDTSRRPRPIPA